MLTTLTGTGSFEFTSNETADIRRYLLGGGMLFADAAGGRGGVYCSLLIKMGFIPRAKISSA